MGKDSIYTIIFLACFLLVAFQNCSAVQTLLLLSEKSHAGTIFPASNKEHVTELGGNYNMDGNTLKGSLVRRSEIEWFRGMIDMREQERLRLKRPTKFKESRLGRNYPAHISAKKDLNMKTMLSFKWHFYKDTENPTPVPAPNSVEEKSLFAELNYTLDQLAKYSDIIVVGNEPIVETRPEDMVFDSAKGFVPMSRFYIRVAIHIDKYLKNHGLRGRKKILMGAFNRLDVAKKRNIEGVQRMIKFALDNDFIDGVDIHVHVPSLAAFEEQLKYISGRIKSSKKRKLLTVSEYSLMWLFKKNQGEPLCLGRLGMSYCKETFGSVKALRNRVRTELGEILNSDDRVTERQFINLALMAPIGKKLMKNQWGNFFYSRYYLPKDFITSSYNLMDKYGVFLATYTFDHNNPNLPETWERPVSYVEGDIPVRISPLFVPQTVESVIEGTNKTYIHTNSYFYTPFKRLVRKSKAFNAQQ